MSLQRRRDVLALTLPWIGCRDVRVALARPRRGALCPVTCRRARPRYVTATTLRQGRTAVSCRAPERRRRADVASPLLPSRQGGRRAATQPLRRQGGSVGAASVSPSLRHRTRDYLRRRRLDVTVTTCSRRGVLTLPRHHRGSSTARALSWTPSEVLVRTCLCAGWRYAAATT